MRLRELATALAVVACATTTIQARADQSVLDKVKQSGVLKVCFAQGTPDNYKDPKTGKWTGVMIDLVDQLAALMKVKVEPVEVSWDVAVLSLAQGTCDLFGSSIVYTVPRSMQVDFVRPFGAKGDNAVILKNNPRHFKTPSDLNQPGVTLVAVLGTREQDTAQRLFPKAKLLAVKPQSDIQIVEQVKNGDADAAVLPAITVKWWARVPENAAWGKEGFPGEDFGNAPNGWAIRYGDQKWKDFLDNYSGWIASNNASLKLYNEYMERTNPFQKKK